MSDAEGDKMGKKVIEGGDRVRSFVMAFTLGVRKNDR